MRLSGPHVLAGVAGAIGTVDGRPIFPDGVTPSGDWRWLVDGQSVVGQAQAGGSGPYELWTADLGQAPVRVPDRIGCYFIEGSGTGAWAALHADGKLRSSWGRDVSDESPIAGGSGFLAIRSHQAGNNVRVFRDDGQIALGLPDAYPVNSDALAVIRDAMLCYWDGHLRAWQLIALPSGQPIPFTERDDVGNVRIPFRVNGRLAFLERMISTSDLTVRYADSQQSYLVAKYGGIGEETYNPDVSVVGDQILVAWSVRPAEEAFAVRTRTVDASFQDVLTPWQAPAPSPVPDPVPTPPSPPEPVPSPGPVPEPPPPVPPTPPPQPAPVEPTPTPPSPPPSSPLTKKDIATAALTLGISLVRRWWKRRKQAT